MKKILTCCALLALAFSARAYELVATVSMEEDAKWHFDIELADNDIDFTAFQLELSIDGDAKLKQKDLVPGELLLRHSLMLGKPEGRYSIAGYNLNLKSFAGKEGPLFSFTIDGDVKDITINDLFFVLPDGTKVEAAAGDNAEEQEVRTVIYGMNGKQTFRIDRRGICIKKLAVKESAEKDLRLREQR